MNDRPRVEIEYCTQCRWLLRATWMAQELLTTFEAEIGGIALVPGTGGVFDVRVEGETLWSRGERGRFPDIAELKQLVRDLVAPGKSLGHTDRVHSPPLALSVECYAGYRGEETPVRFRIGDRLVEVDEVLDRWLAPEHRYFKVRTREGIYILRNDTASSRWELTLFERAADAQADTH